MGWTIPRVTFGHQDGGPSLRDQVRGREQDELKKMEQERQENWEPRCAWSHLKHGKTPWNTQDIFDTSQSVKGVQENEPWEVGQRFLKRLRRMQRERSHVSSHVVDGGGAAFQWNQGDQGLLNQGEVTQDRTSGVIRSSPEIDRQ
jgi:hypothetical protein